MTIIDKHDNEHNTPTGAIQGVSEGSFNRAGRNAVKSSKGASVASDKAIEGKAAGGRVPISGAGPSNAGGARTVGSTTNAGGVAGAGGAGALGKYIGDLHKNGLLTSVTGVTDAVLKPIVNRLRRYDMRALWQHYSTRRAVQCCGYPAKGAKVRIVDHNGVPHYAGVERCKSAWVCAVCASIIRNYRSEQIKKAVLFAMLQCGWQVYMVTRTMHHTNEHQLKYLIKKQAACKRNVDKHPYVTAMYGRLGYQGSIVAKEVTYNDWHGWHAHTHELMFFSRALEVEEYAELKLKLTKYTNSYYGKNDHKGISQLHGIDVEQVEQGADNLGQYLQKLDSGFNANNEIARVDLKKGRGGSRTAFQILANFCDNPNAKDYNLLIEYEDATQGMHVLHWKQGLKAILLPKEDDPTDEQLLDKKYGGPEPIEFENEYFYHIKRKKLDGLILAAYRLKGVAGVIAVLHKKGIHDVDGYTLNSSEDYEEYTAFHAKCDKELKKYSSHIVAKQHAKEANDAMYLNYIKKQHWLYIEDKKE